MLRNKRKSSRGDGAWLATGAVVLSVRHMATKVEGEVPPGLLSPSGPVGAPQPASLSLSAPSHPTRHGGPNHPST